MSRPKLSFIPFALALPLLAWSLSPAPARPIDLGAVIRQDTMDPAPTPDQTAPADPGMESPTDNGGDDGLAVDQKWHANTSALKNLHTKAKIGPYTIRLPSGMKLQKKPMSYEKTTGTTYMWSGTNASPCPGLLIVVAIYKARPGYYVNDVGTEETDLLDAIESRTVDNQQDAVKADRQEGDVHGLTTLRDYFRLTTNHHLKVHGFNYAVTLNRQILIMTAAAKEPNHAKQLALAEASILDFIRDVSNKQ